jgi:hypothetical protein
MTHNFKNLEEFLKYDLNTTDSVLDVLKLVIMLEFETRDFMNDVEKSHSKLWKYKTLFPNFNYVMNNLGFRDITVPNEERISGAFGCSFTFGEGLPVEARWSNLISNNSHSTRFYNFGQPGVSIQHMHDIFKVLSNKIQFEKCIFLFPTFSRFYYIDEFYQEICAYRNIIPNVSAESIKINSSDLYKVITDSQLIYYMKTSIYEIDRICKERNIQAYYSSWDHQTYDMLLKMNLHGKFLPEFKLHHSFSKARDNRHPSHLYHERWANDINNTISI